MLGKQWLNRYDLTGTRGSTIERGQNRQRKFDGVVAWYFEYVMESLPLMLQAALLLLGFALSRYLWEINITVASVVLAVTSFGAIFYVFIVIVGTAFESCPYQTPGAQVLRRILHFTHHLIFFHLLPALRSTPSAISGFVSSTFSSLSKTSWCIRLPIGWWWAIRRPWYSIKNITNTLLLILAEVFIAPLVDAFLFGRVVFRSLASFGRTAYYLSFRRMVYRSPTDTSLQAHSTDQETVALDLRCISWVLQASLDKTIHLSTLQRIESLSELSHFHPSLVLDCFNMFIGCINVSGGKVMVMQGLEQLAAVSATSFFNTFHNLTIMNPTSSVLEDLHRRYNPVFPPGVDFTALPFHTTMTTIHALASRFGTPHYVWWDNRSLSERESIPFSRRMVEVAQANYRQMQNSKVPRRILRSALHFLSLGTVFPPPAIADYLAIIALDLGCDVSDITSLDERYVHAWWIFPFLTMKQRTSGTSLKPHHPEARIDG